MTKIQPVILAGGSGERLWPLSRKSHPKPFVKLVGGYSLIQKTAKRFSDSNYFNPLWVICNELSQGFVKRQLSLQFETILEPKCQNTLVAVARAVQKSLLLGDETPLLISPSDQLIEADANIYQLFLEALTHAKEGNIVLFGLKEHPSPSELGHILLGKKVEPVYKVRQFIEKPSMQISEQHLLNSGLVLAKPSTLLEEFRKHQPLVYKACISQTATNFLDCPEVSFDIGILEKTSNAVVVLFQETLRDLGTWNELIHLNETDNNHNQFIGDVVATETTNSFAWSKKRLVALLGVKNLIVMETDDSVLIADKQEVGKIRNLVKKLKTENRQELSTAKEIFHDWGSTKVLDEKKGYLVSKLSIFPNQHYPTTQLSSAKTTWSVLSGLVEIFTTSKTFVLKVGENIILEKSQIRSIRNIGMKTFICIQIAIEEK